MRYTVVVRQEIAAPPADVWRALTDPADVRGWFGDIDRLVPGLPFRCDFGDGDFFDGETIELVRAQAMRLAWRFMGIGPRFDIQYRLEPAAQDSTIVTVHDTGAPIVAEAECLREGWTDFLGRLDRFVTTGATARFTWNPVIAMSALVPGDPRPLFSLAWCRAQFGTAASAPRLQPDGRIVIDFHDDEWPDRCANAVTIDVHAIDGVNAYVAVTHAGWEQLPEALRVGDRRRYAAAWQSALSSLESIEAVR